VETLGRELHAVAVRLRPRALDEFGLDAALRSFAHDWSRQTGIAVEVHAPDGAARLHEHMESAVYRIVQEALTNVVRHAAATRVSVIVERHDGTVVVVVEDDGKGFDVSAAQNDPWPGGLGLRGIRERVALLGGAVDMESRPGAGTTLYARIPTSNHGGAATPQSERAPSADREHV
jgi:signal transduction histidine kinase